MAVVETRVSVWEALAGRAPGQPLGPAEPGLWSAVVERLNPARAKPLLRPGIEAAELVSVRGVPYVMLRSPDDRGGACYLRLSVDEWRLAQLMDGTRTVARLVADFARIAGRLAPDQVTRVVADLAGNRMLAELPVDAFRRLDRVHRRPWPVRLGRTLLAAAKGQRMVLANVDPLVNLLYRAGGRLLFTRVAAALLAAVVAVGLGLFIWTWWRADQSLFLTNGSYAAGAAVLLGLNVLALACHELGHALATRHAGRRVPAAGFLVYFGIPSVFVDTTDVWMAGRRARMLTTAAGPAAGLILAGLAQIVGLLVPETAPWTFKLAFAWYLNALFNLNPFLALDGYYLLMDWLEIPNLRARGLAFVAGRLRRRPPRWAQLDREGRLVALYGTLAVLWLVIAVNLGWRIWTDRVAGLVLGLWRSGWPARLLLAAVIAGLAAPLVYVAVGWFAGRLRRWRLDWSERRSRSDLPRRIAVLRHSPLGRLPGPALAELAQRASWLRPRTGQPLVLAGAAQPAVYLVADGAVEGRRPGDPGGMVRQRVGAGGVVGLASALTGTPATLSWHTAGTTLLAIPTATVVTAVGPLPGPPPADRAEAEALFAETPALHALSAEDRMGLIAAARPIALRAGDPVTLEAGSDTVVVESGVVALPDGTELRRGTMIGPMGEAGPGAVATARTPVRLWVVPAVSGLPLLFGAPGGGVLAPSVAGSTGGAPTVGVHPGAGYPPLAAPPGPPPADVDDSVDRGFERRLWWLVLLLLLLAFLATGANFVPAPAWAEMPADRALLTAERGRVEVISGERLVVLRDGGKLYVGEGDRIRVERRSTGSLTFRGGSSALLCAGTRTGVGPLFSSGADPIAPRGELTLDTGRLVADTAATSGAFAPIALTVVRDTSEVASAGPARYVVAGGVAVASGEVLVDGIRQPTRAVRLDCGDGLALPANSGDPTAPATTVPGAVPSGSPPTATPSPSATPGPTRPTGPFPGLVPNDPAIPPGPGDDPDDPDDPGTPGETPGPTTSPTTSPSPSPSNSPSPSPSTTPPNRAPDISWVTDPGGTIAQEIDGGPCQSNFRTQAFPVVSVKDDRDSGDSLTVTVRWSGFAAGSDGMSWDGNYYGTVGPVRYSGEPNKGGVLEIRVTATDSNGASTTIAGSSIAVDPCSPSVVS
nr:cyclic nucleotide-binding protein [Micromonospora sp. DSM 115978]